MRRGLLLIPIVLAAAACGGESTVATTSVPPSTTGATTTTAAPSTTASPTTIAPSTTTTTTLPTGSGGAEEHLTEPDLSAFAEAWSSGDVAEIRAFYAGDATYLSVDEVGSLWDGEPAGVPVADDAFAERVAERAGWQMRIIGTPVGVYDKMVAFTFRWEDATEGYDGAALLRYEGPTIWLHTYAVAPEPTPNRADDSSYLSPVDVGALMQVWRDGDVQGAGAAYTADAVILADEDLVRAPWRDYTTPPGIGVVGSKVGWDPAVIGTPARLGDLAVFAWHWEAFDYPAGYGVRLVRFSGDLIDIDIRYAVRPWEAQGRSFLDG